jgi:sugar phosphate isomerase/epimerase
MKFGICNEIFADWPLADAFGFAAAAGYDAVEIAPFTVARRVTELSGARRAEIRDLAARAGVAISGLHWVLARTEGLHLTHPDASVRRETTRYLVELVACCADLGGTRIILGSPQQRKILDGVAPAQAWDWAKEALRDAAMTAAERAVVICFEPLPADDTNFINTAEEARRFAAEFGSAAMSVILDVRAMSHEAKPIPTIIRESTGQFAYFHANDRNLKGPGFGDVDYVPIATALREVGYDGTISVEVFKFDEGAEEIATRSRDYLRRMFPETTPRL